MIKNNVYKKIIFITLVSLIYSCSKNDVVSIQREDLASFDIGRFEGELDLFNLERRNSNQPTEIAMRDGQFFISNSNGQKIVRYNSYGDLLFMIYNEETNPPPLTLKEKTDGIEETRWANPWALLEPSKIAIDSKKDIFVVDKIPEERHSYDNENRAILDRVVLHFDSSGRFVEYLGQEGRAGSPFTRVEDIAITKDDELVVVCRYPKGRTIFTFDSQGNHLSKIKFSSDKLPIPPGKKGALPSLDSIAVSPSDRKIYLKIDYYHEIFDAAINTVAGMEPDSSYIWTVDIEDGAYLGSTEIPFFESVHTEDGKRITENLLYSMFGAMKDNKIFLYAPVDDGFSILILDTTGSNKQGRGVIKISPAELQFFAVNISKDGVLSALLADNDKIKLVWWRTDKLAEEM